MRDVDDKANDNNDNDAQPGTSLVVDLNGLEGVANHKIMLRLYGTHAHYYRLNSPKVNTDTRLIFFEEELGNHRKTVG